MNRFYVPFRAGLKNLWIDSSESHHIVHVKRLKIGDNIIVFNGTGDEFEAEIEQAGLQIRHAQVNWGEIWAEAGNG